MLKTKKDIDIILGWSVHLLTCSGLGKQVKTALHFCARSLIELALLISFGTSLSLFLSISKATSL